MQTQTDWFNLAKDIMIPKFRDFQCMIWRGDEPFQLLIEVDQVYRGENKNDDWSEVIFGNAYIQDAFGKKIKGDLSQDEWDEVEELFWKKRG